MVDSLAFNSGFRRSPFSHRGVGRVRPLIDPPCFKGVQGRRALIRTTTCAGA